MSEAAVTSGKWSNVPVRIGTALAIAAVVSVCLWFGGWVWVVAICILGARIAYEFTRMAFPESSRRQRVNVMAAVVAAVLLYLATTPSSPFFNVLDYSPVFTMTVIMVLALSPISTMLFETRESIGWARASGGAYIILPLIAMISIRNGGIGFTSEGFQLATFIILVVVAADAGAYFSGKSIGGPKFIPRLSPNKTWAGFAGGLVAGGLLGGVLAELWSDDFFEGVLVGLVLVVAAVAGDFLESGFKRHFGVKDTGGILPGHGGVLDRVDSHMAAFTVAAVVIALAPGLSPV